MWSSDVITNHQLYFIYSILYALKTVATTLNILHYPIVLIFFYTFAMYLTMNFYLCVIILQLVYLQCILILKILNEDRALQGCVKKTLLSDPLPSVAELLANRSWLWNSYTSAPFYYYRPPVHFTTSLVRSYNTYAPLSRKRLLLFFFIKYHFPIGQKWSPYT